MKKITHISNGLPIGNWGYQENVLPLYLNKIGYINSFIAYNNKKKENLITENEINYRLIRGIKISTCLIIPWGMYKALKKEKPDLIFHHNVNPFSLPICVIYAKLNKCLVVADNHVDEINFGVNNVINYLVHKVFIYVTCKLFQNGVIKFYGVTLARCYFLSKYYGIKPEKIDFLPIGCHTDLANSLKSKTCLRELYGYDMNKFIIISGGKMGIDKGTDKLIMAVKRLVQERLNVELILFGTIKDNYTKNMVGENSFIKTHDWCNRKKTLELLRLSDIACWPIHHTTLIEDAIAVGTPIIIRKTQVTEHLVEGNGSYIDFGTEEELYSTLKINYESYHLNNYEHAVIAMKNKLSYNVIANKIISDYNCFLKTTNHIQI
jgi:glycosyltransferase involved in cell wall biosynthesis